MTRFNRKVERVCFTARFQKLQRGSAAVVVLLIITTLVIGGSVVYWRRQSQPLADGKRTGSRFESKGTDSPDIAWETYRNEERQYTIQYYPDWHVQTPDEPPYPPPPTSMSFSRQWGGYEEYCDFGILAFPNDPEWHAGEMANLREQGGDEEGTATVDGVAVVTFSNSRGDATGTSYYFNRNDIYYRMGHGRSRTGEHAELCDEVFDHMVSSFRFTE